MPKQEHDTAPAASSRLTPSRRRGGDVLLENWETQEATSYQVAAHEIHPSVPEQDREWLLQQMARSLHSPGGEITARAHTAELGRTYLRLDATGREVFLRLLASQFKLDHARSAKLATAYALEPDPSQRLGLEVELRLALLTPRAIILRQLTALPDGFRFLVRMRADLLPLIGKDLDLKGLEIDLKSILSSWFDIGLLDLVELSWNSAAALLEKLIEYEAVHPIASWDDLKNRLDIDRRVFAFFHNKMPTEPLIFVHVALVKGMSDSVQQLLDEKSPAFDPREADCAIFYSISNAQKGLASISFGNFLIKRVVARLSEEMPHLHTYATLSPVPGFRSWLDPLLDAGDESILLAAEKKALTFVSAETNAAQALLALMNGMPGRDTLLSNTIKPILLRLAARYLLEENKILPGKPPAPLDPVANFHLFNGARIERLNWMGDSSARGLKQSAGIMVNYHYHLSHIDTNHEDYVVHGRVAASEQARLCLMKGVQ